MGPTKLKRRFYEAVTALNLLSRCADASHECGEVLQRARVAHIDFVLEHKATRLARFRMRAAAGTLKLCVRRMNLFGQQIGLELGLGLVSRQDADVDPLHLNHVLQAVVGLMLGPDSAQMKALRLAREEVVAAQQDFDDRWSEMTAMHSATLELLAELELEVRLARYLRFQDQAAFSYEEDRAPLQHAA